MTQGQWLRIKGENPSSYFAGKVETGITLDLRHPVEHVSQVQCIEVLRRLGLILPSNAQWEHACRAGTTTRFHTGDTPSSLQGYANIGDSGTLTYARTGMTPEPNYDDDHAAHAPVGTYLPNPFGLHDMHGNVAEWTADPVETFGSTPRVAMRGGCFYFEAEKARADFIVSHAATHQQSYVGLRPASLVK
jgi:formylglycine-generating enzyme required for sulfatase activity